jgi:hypothetical protein
MLDLSWLATQCDIMKEASPQDAARQQEMHAAGINTFQQPLQWGLAGAQTVLLLLLLLLITALHNCIHML